jgi:hypothetical protein
VAVGVAVGGAVAAIGVALVAVPLFFFARATDPATGLDRPFVRGGLLSVAVPVGIVLGLAAAALAGRWYRRGGQMPREDEPGWRR